MKDSACKNIWLLSEMTEFFARNLTDIWLNLKTKLNKSPTVAILDPIQLACICLVTLSVGQNDARRIIPAENLDYRSAILDRTLLPIPSGQFPKDLYFESGQVIILVLPFTKTLETEFFEDSVGCRVFGMSFRDHLLYSPSHQMRSARVRS